MTSDDPLTSALSRGDIRVGDKTAGHDVSDDYDVTAGVNYSPAMCATTDPRCPESIEIR